MGDRIQYQLVKERVGEMQGPVLEVGSKHYNDSVSFDYRSLFPNKNFIGTDLFEGKNVDVVCNLSDDFETVSAALGGLRFKTIICGSVLEHCDSPFKVASNLEKLLAPNGILFVSVPFSFPVHGYPDDYWRFTPSGIKRLFTNLDFDRIPGNFCSNDHLPGEIRPLEELPTYWLDFRTSKHKREGRWGRFFSAILLRILGKLGIFGWITKHRFAMPVITINMFGVPRSSK